MIIAAGGDGTLYEVINGLAEKDVRPPLGILPLGTTNDFARALRHSEELGVRVDLITQQYAKPIDLGKVRTSVISSTLPAAAR